MRHMRLKAILSLGILLLVIVIGVAAFSNNPSPSSHQTAPVVFHKYYTGGSSFPGVPAITPRSSVTSNTPATSATYTEADVQAYILANGFPGGPVAPGGHLSIVSIQFITAQQAADTFQQDIGRPPDSLVCYVVLHGLFKVGAISGPYGVTPVSEMTFRTGKIVFDAQTGNLLLWSATL